MKVIVDNKIPFIKEAIGKIADEVIYVPGKDFTPALVKDADALIIRTRTQCNRELLQGSRVQFIATATIGFDHIDTEYCHEAGITWTNAPGCNSASVAQYLQSTLLLINLLKGKNLSEMTIGIVGVGNVGIKVAKVARELGMRVLLNDLLTSALYSFLPKNVMLSLSTYLYIRKGNIKLSIWPMNYSSVPSNVLPSSSILPAEK